MTLDRRPAISLIIPAYNEEDYLPACLDAVMANLAGKVHEIIVVDNNSTDRTREVVERYPAVTYVFEGEKGITRARQAGYRASTGDILAYVDADTRLPAGSNRSANNSPRTPIWPACRAPTAFMTLPASATKSRRAGSLPRSQSTS